MGLSNCFHIIKGLRESQFNSKRFVNKKISAFLFEMDSTAATINDSNDSSDSSDLSVMEVDASDNQDHELEKYYDPDSFEW